MGNNWIHTFPKCISAMWNAINLVQDLNSGHRVDFYYNDHYTTGTALTTHTHTHTHTHTYIYIYIYIRLATQLRPLMRIKFYPKHEFLGGTCCLWMGEDCGRLYIYIFLVFANGPRDRNSILGRAIPKTQKWYMTPPCLTRSLIRCGNRYGRREILNFSLLKSA